MQTQANKDRVDSGSQSGQESDKEVFGHDRFDNRSVFTRFSFKPLLQGIADIELTQRCANTP